MRVRAATARRIKPSDLFVRDVEAVCGAGSVMLKWRHVTGWGGCDERGPWL